MSRNLIIGGIIVGILILTAGIGLFSTIDLKIPTLYAYDQGRSGTLEYSIGEYRVVSEWTSGRGQRGELGDVECRPNDCDGKQINLDKNQCPLYERTYNIVQIEYCEGGNFGKYDCRDIDGNYVGNPWGFCYICGKTTDRCGGSQQAVLQDFSDDMVWRASVYKSGELVYKVPLQGWTDDPDKAKYTDGNVEFNFRGLDYMIERAGSLRWEEAVSYDNRIILEPEGKIDVYFENDTSRIDLIEDEEFDIVLTINNSFMRVTARPKVTYRTNTSIGLFKKTLNLDTTNIPLGVTYIPIKIPTSQVTDQFFMSSDTEFFLNPGQLKASGLQVGNGNDGIPFTNSKYGEFAVGSIRTPEYLFRIIPKPLYLTAVNGICSAGYIPSYNDDLCVRSDVKDLSCMQLGCPVYEDAGTPIEYFCTSSGICAETIFIINNVTIDCIDNASICTDYGMTCDNRTGACIDERIYKDIVQCQDDFDCYIPCPGISATCSDEVCEYSGDCESEELDCEDFGCASDYKCVQNLQGRHGCVKDGVNLSDVVIGSIVILLLALAVFIYIRRS